MALTAQRLRQLLDYNPRTGRFIWLVQLQGRGRKGMVAGTPRRYGRIYICIDQKFYSASRLAFLWMLGRWPKRNVDHRDCDPANDKWRNLREATQSQNRANQQARKRDLPKGVRRDKQRYTARINVNYRAIHLGCFDTARAAHAAYIAAARKYFGAYARAR